MRLRKKSSYYESVDSREKVALLLNFYDSYKAKKMSGGKGVDEKYEVKNPEFYKFIMPKSGSRGKSDKFST